MSILDRQKCSERRSVGRGRATSLRELQGLWLVRFEVLNSDTQAIE